MLARNAPPEIVMLIIEELEKFGLEDCWSIFMEELKNEDDCGKWLNRMENFMKKSDIGFCDACGWYHEIERGDHFNQCRAEGRDDKWLCDVCIEIPDALQRELIEQRMKLRGK